MQTQLRRRAVRLWDLRSENGGDAQVRAEHRGLLSTRCALSLNVKTWLFVQAALLDDFLALLRAHQSNPKVAMFREQFDVSDCAATVLLCKRLGLTGSDVYRHGFCERKLSAKTTS